MLKAPTPIQAPRPVPFHADPGNQDNDEQKETYNDQYFRISPPRPVVDVHDEKHGDDPDAGKQKLPFRKEKGVVVFVSRPYCTGAVYHNQSDC